MGFLWEWVAPLVVGTVIGNLIAAGIIRFVDRGR
jgi:hypothetical protein